VVDVAIVAVEVAARSDLHQKRCDPGGRHALRLLSRRTAMPMMHPIVAGDHRAGLYGTANAGFESL
jgi:hypothetical protein